MAAQGRAGHHGRVSAPRIAGASIIICFSFQAVSQHHRLVLSQHGRKVPVLTLLTPGLAQCLPCICVANISQNSCSLLSGFTSPPQAMLPVAELSHGAPNRSAPGAPALAQVRPACDSAACSWCHQLIPEHKNLARGTLLQSAGVVSPPPRDFPAEQ